MPEGIVAIFSDIDDCILPTNGDVSHSLYDGLEDLATGVKLANQGRFPPLSFCTGREYNYVIPVAATLGKPNAWSVVESGVCLFNPAKKLSGSNPLENPALTLEVKKAFETAREKVLGLCQKLPLVFYRGKLINIALELTEGADLTIADCYHRVQEELRDLKEGGLITIRHSSIAVDISPAGIDKASGMKFMSQYTGTDLSRVLGIGDSRGDFPMLQVVGYVGCPSNASKECQEFVQDRGGYISPFEYAAGVADVIRHFLPERG